jgi:hypothetical protein
MALARSLLDLGASLYDCRDMDAALHDILRQARAFAHAEAGTLYLADGGMLRFVAVQNDRLGSAAVGDRLLGRELPINSSSLAGFVAATGEPVSVADCRSLPAGAPFRINRDLDTLTGYRIQSILAIPLNCPNEGCIGVLELFNRLDPAGRPAAFTPPVRDAAISLCAQAALALHNLRLQKQLRQVHLTSILRLSGIAEYRDADTGEHIKRVSRVSEVLASAMGLSPDRAELIKYASPMHDVGKVAIPDAILLKPGHLTAEQRRVMQRHTVIGAEILGRPEDDVIAQAREVALFHHERWDGQGYPNGVSGEDIPLCGRIVGLADVFDAVVSRRCYKDACSLDVAMDIVHNDSGRHFDPAVVEAFDAHLDLVLQSYPELKAA